MDKRIIDILHNEKCSLVVEKEGKIYRYHQRGVRDLEEIYKTAPTLLEGASVADKVIGKAAAGYVAMGQAKELWADVLSHKAIAILQAAGVQYAYGQLTEHIIIEEGDDRCPLEQIVEKAQTAKEVVDTLEKHFAHKRGEM